MSEDLRSRSGRTSARDERRGGLLDAVAALGGRPGLRRALRRTGEAAVSLVGPMVRGRRGPGAHASGIPEATGEGTDVERASVARDRERIARDLHDVVVQRLFATAMSLTVAARHVDDPVAARRVRRAVDDLDETVRRIRTTIFALTAEEGGRTRFRARLLETVEAAAPGPGPAVVPVMDGPLDDRVPSFVADEAVAVLQEGLSNAVRHAEAGRVDVRVSVDERLTVEVADDGLGLPENVRHRGLRNLADRAERLGGVFEVGPGTRSGTVLRWSVPLPDDAA